MLVVAQDQETLRVRSALAADDPGSPDYLAALTGSPISRGNQFDVLVNGDRIFPAMLDAIARATRRVSFETYIFDEGAVAARFTRALEDAARRGVT